MATKVMLEFDYMYKDEVCTTVKVLQGGKIEVQDFTDNIVKRAFGVWGDKATLVSIDKLFESRCFPESRANCKQLLKDIGLTHYAPRQIISHTHGVMSDDLFWIRFSNEKNLCWNDVKGLRNVT